MSCSSNPCCYNTNTNKCNPCCYSTKCTPVCNPVCNPACTPVCSPYNAYNVCNPIYIQPTPPTPVTSVAYITNSATQTAVPSGGAMIPEGTIIPFGSTTIPVGTVTVITGFTAAPTTNYGGVSINNGFFTVPIRGSYIVAANICFESVAAVAPTDLRELLIYRVAASTGLVTLIAADSRLPIVGSSTCINLSTAVHLETGDRLFVAARQINALAASINTLLSPGRFALIRN